ncbi:hypothetical protein [Salinibius halmophilus]|uniref:hypothetical protein n=1 Tax=Salinibius halmophilus TaxID=1853216 RepID=UPI000E66E432|nr:hypothetical protein [Salinibius halmophilus]
MRVIFLLLMALPFSALAMQGFIAYSQGENEVIYDPINGAAFTNTLNWSVGVCKEANGQPVRLFVDFESLSTSTGVVINRQRFAPSHPFAINNLPDNLADAITSWQADIYYAGYKMGTFTSETVSSGDHCANAQGVAQAQQTLNTLVANIERTSSLAQVSLRNVKVTQSNVADRYYNEARLRYDNARQNLASEAKPSASAEPVEPPASSVARASNAETVAVGNVEPNTVATPQAKPVPPMPHNILQPVPYKPQPIMQPIWADTNLAHNSYTAMLGALTVLEGIGNDSWQDERNRNVLTLAALAGVATAIQQLDGDQQNLIGLTTSSLDPWFFEVRQRFYGIELTTMKHLPSSRAFGATIVQDFSMNWNLSGLNYRYVNNNQQVESGSSMLNLAVSGDVGVWYQPSWHNIERLSVTTDVIAFEALDNQNNLVVLGKPLGKQRLAGIPLPIDSLRITTDLTSGLSIATTIGVTTPRWGIALEW